MTVISSLTLAVVILHPQASCGAASCDAVSSSAGTCSRTQPVAEDVGSDDIATAYSALTAAAKELGYGIHEVPRNGNCMFAAVAYQIESIGMQGLDAQTLREMVMRYLTENPYVNGMHYSTYLSQPVLSDDAYNADPVAWAECRWERYLQRLSHLLSMCLAHKTQCLCP